jgi:UDP-glucose 4-epimerase
MSKILVTGGAGYIGSHTIVSLIEKGFEVISIDNLSNCDGSAFEGIEKITGVKIKNYELDLRDKVALKKVFEQHPNIDGLIHFAAVLDVEESVRKPLFYFENNTVGLINLLKELRHTDCRSFIFSSSCTVYGEPDTMPVTEDMPTQEPVSPYGRTKQMGEGILNDCMATGIIQNLIHLRYFNPAGAHESAAIGEDPNHLSRHLVPIITHVAQGIREQLTVFGDDYDTRDGSCVRDYIHVMDLAEAHVQALEYGMQQNLEEPEIINLGSGEGVSVLEAIEAFEKATGIKINYEVGDRRPGDVSAIYANNQKAKKVLDWTPKRDLEEIMRSAWAWEKQRVQ